MEVGDVWLAYVEFADHPGAGKVRPVVVVDVRRDRCVAVAAKVTSKDLRADGSGRCVPIIDWDSCGLRKPSYIRLDQKLEIAFEGLLRDEPIGKLTWPYMEVIAKALAGL
ncbi:type II toxin-antitoxin system PemK/MazF family toxin [Adlercreutzia sp. ZJ305]|uniref:type II toxin-antitoxin system PemK/MazF family toxin n=1 Tax=Adlercreutzia sp. ZJ305 TaxID=2709408 RepID=UPI0013EBB2A0|nr:type II toxin-antitoxin system PemK/MazF family toxin [Adlercreutzia sp. ZJ305]